MHRVTIKDIAKIAGVSYASVSRALNGEKGLSDETRNRILQICQQEGYRINVLARNLARNTTDVLGLIIPDVSNPFFSEIALAIDTYGRKRGYNIILGNSMHDDKTTEDIFEFLIGHQVDGIIFAYSNYDSGVWIRKYSSSVPIVFLGGTTESVPDANCSSVTMDNYAGGRMGAEYLLSLGHRKICYIGYRPNSITHRPRYEGFRDVMYEHHLNPQVIENSEGDSSIEYGYHLGLKYFAHGYDCTAIFAASDSIALGFMQAADEYNVRIPEDISLLGYDNIIYSSLPKIELTTIDQRKKLLGELSVDTLIDLIQKKSDGFSQSIKPVLVKRSSCRAIDTE